VGQVSELLDVEGIPVELRPNKRRRSRIGINISPAGHVVLDVPPSTHQDDVFGLVREHRRWLSYRLNKVREETAHMGRMGFKPGEVVRYLGESLLLEHYSGAETVQSGRVLKTPAGDEETVRDCVRHWYRKQAQIVFTNVLEGLVYLPWLEGKIPKWRHRFMKSQWGSCSSRGLVSLNTHLVRTPIRLIEYVVLHELCHLKHPNHSRRFHSLVSQYMPDWKIRSKELGRNLPLLLDT
jgi:hypothetical protein